MHHTELVFRDFNLDKHNVFQIFSILKRAFNKKQRKGGQQKRQQMQWASDLADCGTVVYCPPCLPGLLLGKMTNQQRASLLGVRTLLVAPGLTTRNKKLLVTRA